jgi:hypothetical protein
LPQETAAKSIKAGGAH